MRVFQVLQGTKNRKLFEYVHCDFKIPDNVKTKFAKFPPTFENILFTKIDLVNLMKTLAEEKRILPQLQKLLIPSFILQNGTLITPLLLFYF